MSKYEEFKQLNLPAIDREILAFWKDNDIFKRSIEERSSDRPFVFYEGPPSANGKPGIHHVMARTVKDLFCRYHTMKGKRVERKGGWDTHGLPVEIQVEKDLGITKEDIGTKISVVDYNKACRQTVMRFKEMWDDLTRKMGYWADLDNPYLTFKNDYIESVWSLLKKLHEKDLLYKGYTVQPYSPAAGTGLSSHELNMPGAYRDVKDTSAVAQFKVVKNDRSSFLFESDSEDVFFIAWTTTPWTLPSNVGLAVGAKLDYVKVRTFNPYTHRLVSLVLAEDLLSKWFKEGQSERALEEYEPGDKVIPYEVLGHYKGRQLEHISYDQLLPYVQPDDGDAFVVVLGNFVTTAEGTGIVHIAPSFGSDDMMVAKKYGLGALTLVDRQGKFVPAVTDFAGRYVKNYKDDPEYRDVNVDIAIKLKQDNRAFNVQKYEHNYPHCWRTDKPVLYYPLDSWFIRASDYRDRMVALNNTINWKPDHTGEKRFGNWLENLQDWNLSRSRYWGTPLPIWRTEDGLHEKCIGSIAELREELERANVLLGLKQSVPEDLHKPFVDEIVLVTEDGKQMNREPDLIDVWFDSGAMPYAQWHYPMENESVFQRNFPADYICEGVDQTRGWFYSLHAIATMVYDSVAFKNVVSTGLLLDKSGVKMSKRLGNVVDPFETLQTYGADATRWYMMTNSQPWDNLKFDIAGVEEVRRKFFGTLYNTYSFFALYANIDGFTYQEEEVALENRQEIDRWILSLLNSLVEDVSRELDNYEPTNAGRMIQDFVENHLSNWYVRLCRRRFWKGDYTQDKIAAYQTLYTCMTAVTKLMAPIAPFFADWLYRNLNRATKREPHSSVHLTLIPAADRSRIDPELEERMDYAQRICSLVLSLRKREKIRVRQPLKRILLPILGAEFKNQVETVKTLILAEVNVKDIEYITDTSGIITKRVRPNFKSLGRRLGKHMKEANRIISGLSQNDITQIEQNGSYLLEIEGSSYVLEKDDFEISTDEIPGWQVAADKDITVALDIGIDEDLKKEGIAREIVNRIQNIRKQSGLDVTDRIHVNLGYHPMVEAAVAAHQEYISQEVLSDDISIDDQIEAEKVLLVDDIELAIEINKS